MTSELNNLFAPHPDWLPRWEPNPEDKKIPLMPFDSESQKLVAHLLNNYHFYYDFPTSNEYKPVTDLTVVKFDLLLTPLSQCNLGLVFPTEFVDDIEVYFTERLRTIDDEDPSTLIIVPHIDPSLSGLLVTPIAETNSIFDILSAFNFKNYSGIEYHKIRRVFIDNPEGYTPANSKYQLSHNDYQADLGLVSWGCFSISDIYSPGIGAFNIHVR